MAEEPDFFLPSQQVKPQFPSNKEEPDFPLPSQVGKKEAPSLSSDVTRGAVSGVAEGLISRPSTAGSLGQLYDVASEKLLQGVASGAEKLGLLPKGKTADDLVQAMHSLYPEKTSAEKAGYINKIYGVPLMTGTGAIEAAKRGAQAAGVPQAVQETAFYEPQTPSGRVVKGTTEMAVGTPGKGGVLIGGGSGLTSSAAGEVTRGTEYEPYARVAGGILGAIFGGGASALFRARSPEAVATRAEDVAARVMKESVKDPAAVAARIRQETAESAKTPFVEGVEPTTRQLGQVPEIGGLEKAVEKIAEKPSGTQRIEDISRGALQAEGRELPQDIMQKQAVTAPQAASELQESFGLTGINPQASAANDVKSIVSKLEKAKADAETAAWQDPSLQNAMVFKNKSINAIEDYLNGLTVTQRNAISKDVFDTLKEIKSIPSRDISLQELQQLRSSILSDGRELFASGNNFAAMAHNELAGKIADILNDQKNIVFGGNKGAAITAWNNARALTKEYHNTFDQDFVSKLIQETRGGSQKIAGEDTFKKMFGGSNAVQNLDQVRSIPGINVDRQVGNWLIGDLTKNGTKLDLTQKDVAKYLADPVKAQLVDRIPGLRAKMQDIAQKAGESELQSRNRQLTNAFDLEFANNNPNRLSNFISRNETELKSFMTPQEAQSLDSIKRTADLLSYEKSFEPVSSNALKKLAGGDLIGLLYGRAIGAISDSAVAEVANLALSAATGIKAPGAGVLARAANVPELTKRFSNIASHLVFGKTKEEAVDLLQKAFREPEVAAMLLEKPTPENIQKWISFAGARKIISTGAEGAMRGAETIVPPLAVQQQIDQSNRQGRKAGGKVKPRMSHDQLVARLMKLSADAKKHVNNNTKPLLNVNDESIVHALAVAKRNI
jgi:hypothetical protein